MIEASASRDLRSSMSASRISWSRMRSAWLSTIASPTSLAPPRRALSSLLHTVMTEARVWNARSLAEALSGTELFSSGEAQIELIEGAEASLYVIMREYGDLPVFVAPQGEQIIVEALLWPESDVTDATAFNEEVLLSRQLFPHRRQML